MASIRIRNLFDRILDPQGREKSLLQCLQNDGIDWMHACGGKGRCTTCKVIVHEGFENLSADTDAEIRYRRAGALHQNEKLSCQSRVLGDVVISAPDEYKLPHITYSDPPAG